MSQQIKKTVAFRLYPDMIEKLNELREKTGSPATWHVEKALEVYLKNLEKQKKAR